MVPSYSTLCPAHQGIETPLDDPDMISKKLNSTLCPAHQGIETFRLIRTRLNRVSRL